MRRSGFTLVELLIAMVVGLLVLTGAVSFAISQTRVLEGSLIREEVYRNARYVNLSLKRDIQRAGVGIESTQNFGVLTLMGDTIIVMQVPFNPAPAIPYDMMPPAGTDNPLPVGGTCGERCIDFLKVGGSFEIRPGDVARLQVSGERRLILVSDVQEATGIGDGKSAMRVVFTSADSLLGYAAGLVGGLRLDRFETFTQKLEPIIYYVDGTTLMRAEKLNADGSPAGEIVAFGVQSFDAKLVFADGRELDATNPLDADNENDNEDVVGIRINLTLTADRADARLNSGALFSRSFEWFMAPRNLRYARNR